MAIEKFVIVKYNPTQNVLTYHRHLCCWQWLEKINLANKIELTREHFLSIICYNFRRGFSRQDCIDENWSRQHFRSLIFYNFRRGLSRKECIDEIKSLFDDKAPFYSAMKNWLNEFNCGRRLLKDAVHEAASKTAIVSENIAWTDNAK